MLQLNARTSSIVKVAFAAVALAAALLLTAAPASAQYNNNASVSVSSSTVVPGGSVTLTARGFKPGTTVSFSVGGVPVGSAVADGSGVATLTVTLPSSIKAGSQTVRAAGTAPDGSPLVVTTTLVVSSSATPADADDASGLADTGSNSGALARSGVAVLVLGALLVVVARRGRSHSTAS